MQSDYLNTKYIAFSFLFVILFFPRWHSMFSQLLPLKATFNSTMITKQVCQYLMWELTWSDIHDLSVKSTMLSIDLLLLEIRIHLHIINLIHDFVRSCFLVLLYLLGKFVPWHMQAVFMICVVSAIDPCQRYTICTVLVYWFFMLCFFDL